MKNTILTAAVLLLVTFPISAAETPNPPASETPPATAPATAPASKEAPAKAAPSALVAALRAANPDYKYDPGTLSVDEKKGIIKIHRCNSFTNIEPLAAVDFCTDLTLHGCGVASLEPIKKFKLTRLDVGDCLVADLSPLRGMPITDLVVVNCKVTSLEPLSGMPLRALKTCIVTASFYEVIGKLKTLEDLELYYCQLDPDRLKKLQPTFKSLLLNHVTFTGKKPVDLDCFREQPLTSLLLFETEAANWSALSKYRNLKFLSLRDVAFDDTQPLTGLPLETLSINNSKPRPLTITGISALPLKQLTMKNCTVDLKPLAGSAVQELTFTLPCVIGGVEALRECRSLTSLTVFTTNPAGKEDRKTYTGPKAVEDFLREAAVGKEK